MASSQRPKGRDGALPTLDAIIQILNLAKDTCDILPARAVFGAAIVLLTMIRVRFPPSRELKHLVYRVQDTMVNDKDYVDLGMACADVCQALDRGLKGRRLDQLSQSVLCAINQLTT